MSRDRVRCKVCGSTRVSGITLAYVDGPLVVRDGRMAVDERLGECVVHDADLIESGSIVCANCGGGQARIERAERERSCDE